MSGKKMHQLAGIQYVGVPGSSKDCLDAVLRLLQYGDEVTRARILSCSSTYCLLLTFNVYDLVAIKSGFSSGYIGEGPRTFSYVLQILDVHKAEIDEYDVDEDLIERIDTSSLTVADIDNLDMARPIRPSRWPQYVSDSDRERRQHGTFWKEFPPVVPLAIIDPRIADLALFFWEGPDDRLLTGYRRLEDVVRKRTGIDEHGARLFSQAFLGDTPKLSWKGIDESAQKGRGNLFTATYMAFRNPRAHREMKNNPEDQLVELLLLNNLYILESKSYDAFSGVTG